MNRRQFLKTGLMAGGISLLPNPLNKAQAGESSTELLGVLVDTTRCIGCRRCEHACATANNWAVPDPDDKSVFGSVRDMDQVFWTVVNRFDTEKGQVFVKKQCMHCNDPACASACLVRAMYKLHDGPIIWRENKCMGCRYCMVACPFDVPKFEYNETIPSIQKCNFCFELQKKGLQPACVAACPVDALMFGTRRQLVEHARARMGKHPHRYHPHVYGEQEVGGTSWMYLSGVPFEQIGFRTDLGHTAVPEFTKGFLHMDPVIFVLWTSLLLGLHQITKKREGSVGSDESASH